MSKLILKWYKYRLAVALGKRDLLLDDDKIDAIDEKIWKLKGKVAYWTARVEL